MGTLKEFKFKKIKNFFNKDELTIISKYCEIKHRNTIPCNEKDIEMNHGDWGYYADPLMESLLNYKKDVVEKESGLELHPTYSFWRMYTYGSRLPEHTDRPSCEISVTAHIDGAANKWPIFVDGKKIVTEPGDAVLYLGIDLKHSRDILNEDFESQVFLHYVDANGINKDYKYDKRIMLGYGEK